MIKTAVISGCIVGIAASLADVTVSGKFRSGIRVIIALLLIVVVTGPFMKTDFKTFIAQYIDELEDIQEQRIQQTMSEDVMDEAENRLSQYIAAKLETAGIKPKSVSIELTVTSDGLAQVVRTDVTIEKNQIKYYDDIKRIVDNELMQGEVNVTWEEKGAEENKTEVVRPENGQAEN